LYTRPGRAEHPMPWYPPELEQLTAIVAAELDENGGLIAANSGFMELIKVDGLSPSIGTIITRFFIQPRFAAVVDGREDDTGNIYSGLLTIGEFTMRTQTLRGRIWRKNQQLCVLAEYDIAELGRLNDAILELNREHARMQLELAQMNLRLRQREVEIRAVSLTDQLTGVGNRRRLDQAIILEISGAERTRKPLCGFMGDLDHFKRVNDTYGHEAGDKVLTAFGELLRRNTRPMDVVGRFGGEEFLVLMPHTDLEDAVSTAERLREALASVRIEPLSDPITVSVGVAKLAPGESGETFLGRVDSALYEAKHMGRNQVIVR
jgi:two-component system, cell cycle response regulator